MTRRALAWPATLCLALGLSACGSARFAALDDAPDRQRRARPAPAYNQPGPEAPVEAVPSGSVSSAPLPPPPGAPAPQAAPAAPPAPAVVADLPPQAAAPRAEPPPAAPAPPRAPAAPSQSTLVGGWTAREATGGTCRVVLSSTSAVDRYRASATGCANRDLAAVNAWEFRDGEVYLYQPGGAVAARLRTAGGTLEGAVAKSGAPLSLTR